LGELGIDQPPGGFERAAPLHIAPAIGHERFARRVPQRGRRLVPARTDRNAGKARIELLERAGSGKLLGAGRKILVPTHRASSAICPCARAGAAPRRPVTVAITRAASAGSASPRHATWPSGRTSTKRFS